MPLHNSRRTTSHPAPRTNSRGSRTVAGCAAVAAALPTAPLVAALPTAGPKGAEGTEGTQKGAQFGLGFAQQGDGSRKGTGQRGDGFHDRRPAEATPLVLDRKA